MIIVSAGVPAGASVGASVAAGASVAGAWVAAGASVGAAVGAAAGVAAGPQAPRTMLAKINRLAKRNQFLDFISLSYIFLLGTWKSNSYELVRNLAFAPPFII
jgi:hypothetical protein